MLHSGLSVVGFVTDAAQRYRDPLFGESSLTWGMVVASATVLLALPLVSRRPVPDPGAGRVARTALSMLPEDVRAAVTAVLRADSLQTPALTAAGGPESVGARPAPAANPPYLFVVHHDHPQAFSALRDLAWSRPDLLGVVFDRRWMGDRRSRHEVRPEERRSGDRRRGPAAAAWTPLGFTLVEADRPVPASTPSMSPPPRPAAPIEPTSTVSPSVARARSVSPARPRSGSRGVTIGLWILLAVSVAALSIGLFYRPAEVTSPMEPAPAAAAGVLSLRDPPPSRVASRTSPPAAAAVKPATPSEPVREAGIPVDRCVTPAVSAVAIQGQEVLGDVVGVKIDANAQPPRCLFVIEREDGVQWVVDSARVQIRPR